MRILAIADRPPRRLIRDIIAETPVDLIVTLGDLESQDLRGLDMITNIPKLGVYGNHCSGNYFDGLGITNMHLNTFTHKGITFGGFEGCVRYKESAYAIMYTQEEADALLKNFPRVDVILAHCPPLGVNDDQTDIAHTGYRALATYIEEMNPGYLFHGHTYPKENELVKKYLNTKIVYVYQDAIIEI